MTEAHLSKIGRELDGLRGQLERSRHIAKVSVACKEYVAGCCYCCWLFVLCCWYLMFSFGVCFFFCDLRTMSFRFIWNLQVISNYATYHYNCYYFLKFCAWLGVCFVCCCGFRVVVYIFPLLLIVNSRNARTLRSMRDPISIVWSCYVVCYVHVVCGNIYFPPLR